MRGPLDPFPNLWAGWPKGKPRRQRSVSVVIFGADPNAPVHRGGAKMPWREHASKIRCPETGLLLDPPRGRRRTPHERTRSSHIYKLQALAVLSDPTLGPRQKRRRLARIKAECALFRRGLVAGVLDAKVELK